MKKIYLVITKKRIATPKSETTFTGIVKIIGAYDSEEKANEGLVTNYKKEKSDFYAFKEAFVKGDVTWNDDFTVMRQEEDDKTVTVTWEIKEVEVE